ncbi:MAG: sigma-70 family RNA polymerase sigma factor [Fusicatenibacter sp.]|nr:sigma-70 family RNA polymerase sigma factor [Fusicatenibacter sp.]
MKRSEFERVYKEKAVFVYQEAYYQVGNNHALAEDITQEVFLKLYISIEKIREDDLKGWLKTVVRNTTVDYFRKSSHIKELSLDDLLEFPAKDGAKNLEEVHRFEDKVMDALFAHNPEWYYLVRETKFNDRTYKELAAELGTTVGHVGVKLHRARSWLHKQFGDEAKDLGIL